MEMEEKIQDQENAQAEDSPPWSRTTKTIVAVIALLLLALIAWRFQSLIGQIVTAAVLAYVLNPVIKMLDENTPINRGPLTVLAYLVLLLLVIGASTALGVAAYGQILNLIDQLPAFINDLVSIIRQWATSPTVSFGPFEFSLATFDWSSLRQQLLGYIEPVLSRSGQYAGQLAGTTLRTVTNFLFVWVISIYIALEIPRLGDYVSRAAYQPGYQRDARKLMSEFGRIWSAYLRGQIILGLTIGIIVGVTLALLGVQNALALGILSGVLEFVPVVGPVIGAGAAVIVAFFQPANYLGLTALQYAVVVLAVMFVIQQLENNILVPRIVGDALDLHPLMVIIGVFMGANVAGILGAILAAPLLATFKLLGVYAWRKMFDLQPFQDEGEMPPSEPEELAWRARLRSLWERVRKPARRIRQADRERQ